MFKFPFWSIVWHHRRMSFCSQMRRDLRDLKWRYNKVTKIKKLSKCNFLDAKFLRFRIFKKFTLWTQCDITWCGHFDHRSEVKFLHEVMWSNVTVTMLAMRVVLCCKEDFPFWDIMQRVTVKRRSLIAGLLPNFSHQHRFYSFHKLLAYPWFGFTGQIQIFVNRWDGTSSFVRDSFPAHD